MNHASFTPISFPHPVLVTMRAQLVSVENYEPSTNETGHYVPEHVQIVLIQDFVPQPELAGVQLAPQKYPITLWQPELIQSFRTHGFSLGAVVDFEGYLVLTTREDGVIVPKIWPLRLNPAPINDDATNPAAANQAVGTDSVSAKPKSRCFFTRCFQRRKKPKAQ